MTLTDALIAELTSEAATTRRVLERVPGDKLSWRPHQKSMTLGQLALHIAQLPGAIANLVSQLTVEVPAVPVTEATSRDQLLSTLDESVATATEKLSGWGDTGLMARWKMTRGPATLLEMPRIGMIRSVMLNHWYHHRGQLVVYLRLLDVPVPSVYGPTADEKTFG
jgi:uncharacterized damage-inducible protein DinB